LWRRERPRFNRRRHDRRRRQHLDIDFSYVKRRLRDRRGVNWPRALLKRLMRLRHEQDLLALLLWLRRIGLISSGVIRTKSRRAGAQSLLADGLAFNFMLTRGL
jgi:hypothetical protein